MVGRKAKVIVKPAEEAEGRGEDQNVAADAAEGGFEVIADAPSADSVTGEDSGGFTVVDRSNETFSAVEVIEAPRRGRPAGSSTTRQRVPKATGAAIAQAAPIIVGLANQAVVTWAGPECAMLQVEANFLVPSVARIIERLPRSAAQQMSVYTDPFIVIMALGLWAARIGRIKDAQAKQKYQVEPFEAARAYGESGTEFTTAQPTHTEPPIANTAEAEPRQNGAADAILRTVSPT